MTKNPERKPRLKVWLGRLLLMAIVAGGISLFGVFYTWDHSQRKVFDEPGYEPIYRSPTISETISIPLLITAGVCFLLVEFILIGQRYLLETENEKKDYHGSAGFAAENDTADLINYIDERAPLEEGRFALAPAAPAGRLELPRKIVTRHVAVLGPSGAGKTYSFFLPNCAWTQGASFVATDPKGEIFNATSGYHVRPLRYAPRQPEASACFNWIPLCTEPHFTLLLARAVMESDGPAKGKDEFFVYAESALLAAIFAHANTLETPTPASAYDFITSYRADQFIPLLLESPSPLARQFARIFEQTEARLRGGLITAVMTRILFLADPLVRRFTSAELAPPDFSRLRREPTAVYWILHENDVSALRPLSALFFTLLLYQIKQAEANISVTLYLDEFANIGRIPDFQTEITVARGRDVAFVLGIQSMAQLEEKYDRAGAQVIYDNCQTKIAMSSLAYDSAEMVSRELGDATIMIPRTSYTSGGITSGSTTTFSVMDSKRRLLTPDEIRRLDEDKLLVISTNRRPLMLKRFDYTPSSKPAAIKALGAARAEAFTPMESTKPALPPAIPAAEITEMPRAKAPELPNRL